MYRKTLSLFLAFAMLVTVIPSAGALDVNGYSDTTGHWAEAAIDKWSGRDVLNGYPDGTFRPNQSMTVAELVTVLDNIMDYQIEAQNTFADVPAESWYESAVLKAVHAGVITADGAGKLYPDQVLTRQQGAAMICRAFHIQEITFTAGYTDYDTISPAYLGYINALTGYGVLSGYPDGSFQPLEKLSRAHVMTILENYFYAYIQTSGVYTTTTAGSALVRAGGVTLSDLTVRGDLIIADAVGSGKVTLNNVVVFGNIYLRGGSTLTVSGNSSIGTIYVDKQFDGEITFDIADTAIIDEVVLLNGKVKGYGEEKPAAPGSPGVNFGGGNPIGDGDDDDDDEEETPAFIAVTDLEKLNISTVTAGTTHSLYVEIIPANATNQTVTWNMKDAGTTGAVISSGNKLTVSQAGTLVLTAVVKDGKGEGSHFTKDFTVVVTEAVGSDVIRMTLKTTPAVTVFDQGDLLAVDGLEIVLTYADFSTEIVSATDFEDKGITLSPAVGSVLSWMQDSVYIEHTATGLHTTMSILVEPTAPPSGVPVTEITGIPTEILAGEVIDLSGVEIYPATASHKIIVWRMTKTAGTRASIQGGRYLHSPYSGIIEITAYIEKGGIDGEMFTQTFPIRVKDSFYPGNAMQTYPVPFVTQIGELFSLQYLVYNTAYANETGYAFATNSYVFWEILDDGGTGATISGSSLITYMGNVKPGVMKVQATVVEGLALYDPENPDQQLDFVKEFDVTILPKTLTALQAPTLTLSKTYDGTTTAQVSAPYVAVSVGKEVILHATAEYDSPDVGMGKTITVTYSLSGRDAEAYSAPAPYVVTNGVILAQELTVEGLTAAYAPAEEEGAGNLTLDTSKVILNGVVPGEDVSLTGTPVVTITRPYTPFTPVAVSGYSLSGTAIANYKLIQPNYLTVDATRLTFRQDQKSLEIDLTSDTATYGQTLTLKTRGGSSGKAVTYMVVSGPGCIDGDQLKFTGIGEVILRAVMQGDDTYNAVVSADAVINVGKKSLSVIGTQVAADKVYDGINTATVSNLGTIMGIVQGDDVKIQALAQYDSHAVGTNKTIEVQYILTGKAAECYQAPAALATMGSITPLEVTVSGVSVTYEATETVGSGTVTITETGELKGVIGDDAVSLIGEPTATIEEAPSTRTRITVSGYTLGGADADNYVLIQPYAYVDTTAVTTKAEQSPLILSAGSDTMTYTKQASRNRTLSTTGGDGDGEVTYMVVSGSAVVDGNTLTITAPGIVTLVAIKDGDDRYNAQTGEPFSILVNKTIPSINKAPVLSATTKVYDGTTDYVGTIDASAMTFYEMVAEDDVYFTVASAYYSDAQVGTGQTLTVVFELAGADAYKYGTPYAYVASRTGSITPKELTTAGETAVYIPGETVGSGTVYVVNTNIIDGIVTGDDVRLTPYRLNGTITPPYSAATPVTVNYELQGADAKNYTVAQKGGITVNATTITGGYISVTDIEPEQSFMYAGQKLNLTATVTPADASDTAILWSLKDAGTTGAVLNGNQLTATSAGTIIVTALIENGIYLGGAFTKEFEITVLPEIIPITNIVFDTYPRSTTVGTALSLASARAIVNKPSQYQEYIYVDEAVILWTIKDAGTTGATVTDSIFTATADGIATLTATVIDGIAPGVNYTREFKIAVTSSAKSNQGILQASAMNTHGEPVTTVYYGDGSLFLSPNGGSGNGSVTFALLSGPAVINGQVMNITAPGTVTFFAIKEGDGTYNPRVSSIVTLHVNTRPLTFDASANGSLIIDTKVYDGTPYFSTYRKQWSNKVPGDVLADGDLPADYDPDAFYTVDVVMMARQNPVELTATEGIPNKDVNNADNSIYSSGDGVYYMHADLLYTINGPDAYKYYVQYMEHWRWCTIKERPVTVIGAEGNYSNGVFTLTKPGDIDWRFEGSDLFEADDVTLDYSQMTYTVTDNENGTVTVTLSGVQLVGEDAFNYALTQPTFTFGGTVNALLLPEIIGEKGVTPEQE